MEAAITLVNAKPDNKASSLAKSNSLEANERDNKTRRKVVIGIGVVTFALVIMSILIMAITIHMTPSIDEKIRKEHEELVRKMNEGSLKSMHHHAAAANLTFDQTLMPADQLHTSH